MTPVLVYPVFAMVALTGLVWCIGVVQRIAEINQRRIPLQTFATSVGTMNTLKNTQGVDNFNNLMQLPVLFYLLCFLWIYLGLRVTVVDLGAIWLFVILRVLHSLVHVTVNRVKHRFYLWVTSSVVLFVLWGLLVFRLLIQ